MTTAIAADGFVSANLAPNLGSTPAGLYYTAIYQMSDGTTSTEYWVVPAAAQATIGQVRAQLMPAVQAVQAVSKSYVDQSIAQAMGSQLTASGGNLTGPLFLSADPTQALQAADKHYVDATFAQSVPLAGGNMTGPLQTPTVNGVQSPATRVDRRRCRRRSARAGATGAMVIPPNYAGTDGFTNPNGVRVTDLRTVGRAANRAQREGVRRGLRWDDGRHECVAGSIELCADAWSGADDSAGNMQDADADLARGVDWRAGQAGVGTDGISGAGCAGNDDGQSESVERIRGSRPDDLRGSERGHFVFGGGGTGACGKLRL